MRSAARERGCPAPGAQVSRQSQRALVSGGRGRAWRPPRRWGSSAGHSVFAASCARVWFSSASVPCRRQHRLCKIGFALQPEGNSETFLCMRGACRKAREGVGSHPEVPVGCSRCDGAGESRLGGAPFPRSDSIKSSGEMSLVAGNGFLSWLAQPLPGMATLPAVSTSPSTEESRVSVLSPPPRSPSRGQSQSSAQGQQCSGCLVYVLPEGPPCEG